MAISEWEVADKVRLGKMDPALGVKVGHLIQIRTVRGYFRVVEVTKREAAQDARRGGTTKKGDLQTSQIRCMQVLTSTHNKVRPQSTERMPKAHRCTIMEDSVLYDARKDMVARHKEEEKKLVKMITTLKAYIDDPQKGL